MTKITPLMIFLLSLIVIINTFISPSSALISDKRLCYDEKCSEPISLAKTLINYTPNDTDILPFRANVDVKVFSKSAGNRPDLWGVEVHGKRGYIPKRLVREYKILRKELSFEVPTESLKQETPKEENLLVPEENPISKTEEKNAEDPVADFSQTPEESTPSSSSENREEQHEKSVIDSSTKDIEHSVPILKDVSPSYEVVDGTTIPLVPNESSDYPSQSIGDVEHDQEPVLSVEPHPDLVSSTLSFVSKVFDRVAERFDKAEIENQAISGTENNEASNKFEEEQKETLKEGEVEHEESKNEASTESEDKKEDTNDQPNSSVVPESENQVEPEVKKEEEEPKVIDSELEKNVSEETEEEEEEGEDDEESGEEDGEDEESGENHPVEEQILEEKTQVTHPEEPDLKIESDSMNISSLENEISPEVDVNNNEIQTEEANYTNVHDLPLQDQVPLPDSQITGENVVPTENKDAIGNLNSNANNVAEAQDFTEESRNVTSETTEQDVLVDQIQEPETVDVLFNVSESTNEIKHDVNIVDSENDVSNDNETSAEGFESSKIEDSIPEEVASVGENVFSSESDIVSKENDIVPIVQNNSTLESLEPHFHEEVEPDSSQRILAAEQVSSFNEFPNNRNLLNVDEGSQYDSQESPIDKASINEIDQIEIPNIPLSEEIISGEEKPFIEDFVEEDLGKGSKMLPPTVLPPEVCEKDLDCAKENVYQKDSNAVTHAINMGRNYWEFLAYLLITSVTILIFSLGYYYIENARRDSQLIAKINKLEKEVMISTKECILLNENLSSTKTKLNSIEDESFGSNEMVASLKVDLEALQNAKLDLEDQVATLEKELESATEAGLELEKMLREFLSSNNEDNPLAQSIEDLQARLNAQQAENEALTNALNLNKQETEGLSSDLLSSTKKNEELEIEIRKLEEELKTQGNMKIYIEQTLEDKVQRLEMQIREMMEERSQLRKGLKAKELEVQHLLDVVDQENSNNIDFDKLYDASEAKAEALQLAEERNELQVKLNEVESAHQLMEDHVKSAKEEVISLTEQCRNFEKERKEAETKLEVLSNFFKEKETQRQKEEAAWLQKQGEVSSTVERIHTMQNEIQNYKQQIEILKREIVDQEREYKSQIGALETKAHEHWVVARQNERRLEELKAESGQLRNRLTLVEKSMNDPDPDVKLHRMETNGETATSPSLFLGADSSSSPIMFSNSSGVPPPPPSYMFAPPFHPYLPPLPHGPAGLPPFDVGQRPPPLGGRLSSPPPLPHQPLPPGRYENPGSPPPLSPPLPPHYGRRRSPPPPFSNDRIHPPPPPPPSLLPIPPLGSSHNWGEESLPPLRNLGFHPHQRDQRARNHKGSLHSSGESLDKSHHSGKV